MRNCILILAILTLMVSGCKVLTPQHRFAIVTAHEATGTLFVQCVGDPNDPNDGDRKACEQWLFHSHMLLAELRRWAEE